MTERKPDDGVAELASSIGAIAERLRELEAQAKALGIFTNDRELLSCPECGLMEDVLASGLLVTCRRDRLRVDTGLRFVESPEGEGVCTCPACGTPAEQEQWSIGGDDG